MLLTLRRRVAAAIVFAALFALPVSSAGALTPRQFARAEVAHYAAAVPPGVDQDNCLNDAGHPAPGTPEWQQRDTVNQYCATLRLRDQLLNPAYGNGNRNEGRDLYIAQAQEQVADGPGHIHGGLTTLVPGSQSADVFRALDRWTAAGLGRVKRIAFNSSDGAQLRGHVFEPNGTPPGHGWPGVVITDGSVQAYEQLYYWAAEDLVAHGYEVMTYDVQGQGDSDAFPAGCPSASSPVPTSCRGVPYQQNYNFYQGAEDSLGWFLSSANPYRGDLNPTRVGIAGHSLGAAAVSNVAQCDKRVRTVVAWDNLSAVKDCSGVTVPARYQPARNRPTPIPSLALTNDYAFNPQPANPNSPPNPHGKMAGYNQVAAAGKDAMIVAFRNATHLTYSYIPYVLPANELSERMASYYTVAWFDRYLKGDNTGTDRLTATAFNDSADTDSIGTGTYDLAAGLADPTNQDAGNVPYKIAGIAVDRAVSFYYQSAYSLHDTAGNAHTCVDMRADCPAVEPPTP